MGVITHFHVAAWARTLDTGLLILSSIQATSFIVPRNNNTALTMALQCGVHSVQLAHG